MSFNYYYFYYIILIKLEEHNINSDLDCKTPLIEPSHKAIQSLGVALYDEMCEENFKISSITPLMITPCKFILFLVLNILTVGLINLIIVWFPNTRLSVLYSETDIDHADYVGLSCNDGKFYIVNLNKVKLPMIKSSSLSNMVNTNVSLMKNVVYMFTFKLFKYVYDCNQNDFKCVVFDITAHNDTIITKMVKGLSKNEHIAYKKIYGECDLNIDIPSFGSLLFEEFSDPFYLFQIFSFILWINNGYEAYAYVIIVTTILSLLIATYETRSNLINIQQMAKYQCDVFAYREGKRIKIESSDLVPGDVFELPDDGCILPCDALLLNGSVIMNEAMLTGESTPIFKVSLPAISTDFVPSKYIKNILYSGTKIIQKRLKKSRTRGLKALVLNTAFNTKKGNLIRSILFPKQVDFKFKKDSVRYIIIMAILSFVGFVISLPFLIKSGMRPIAILKRSLDLVTTTVPPALPACLGIGITYALSRLKSNKISCINRNRVNIAGKVDMICFDKTGTLTEDHLDISGFRPVTFNNNEIVFSNYITDCTVNSKKAYSHYKNKFFSNEHDKSKDLNQLFVECLACCHSITRVKGKLIGDPIDVKMFESTSWLLNECEGDDLISTYVRPSEEKDLEQKLEDMNEDDNEIDEESIINSHYEIGIVKCFDFSSQLQRMSVIAKNSNDKYFKVFTKGSPEKIVKLCKAESIPKNFNDVLNSYTLKGARVLALACKMVKMDFLQSQKISREKVESNLIFLGLLIVQNKLKEKTIPSIKELSRAKLRMVMATGDNILTAIAVSKECGLIQPDATVYTCDINRELNDLDFQLVENYSETEEWNFIEHVDGLKKHCINEEEEGNELEYNDINESDVDNEENENVLDDKMNTFTKHFEPESINDEDEEAFPNDATKGLLNNDINRQSNENDSLNISLNIDIEKIPKNPFDPLSEDFLIAITGPVFESLWKLRNKYISSRDVKYLKYNKIFRMILKNCYIFARMSPEHKTLLVQSLREEKFTVLMCGDGANDCGALKSADVGVSLSTEEASIAAHFSSEIFDISCISKLLLEGKASLVTSIQTFKYMMLYSLIQFISVTMLMVLGSYLTDYQFLSSDLVIIFPLAFLISRTEATDRLTHHRPTGALISVPIITSILMQTVLMFSFQLLGWYTLTFNDWYVNYCRCNEMIVYECFDNTVVFLVSNMQYLISAIAFSISYPFKKSIFTNYLLVICLTAAFTYSAYLIVIPDEGSRHLLQLSILPSMEFRYIILFISTSNFIMCYLVERYLVPFISKKWKKYKYDNIKRELDGKPMDYKLNQIAKLKKLSM